MTKLKKLSWLCVLFISACETWVPAHEYCVLKSQSVEFTHPASGESQTSEVILGAWCSKTDANDDAYWKPAGYMHKWISRSPRTEQNIIDAAKRNCSK